MNVSRDVVTDLLPVYFSGDASEDTKRLMEEYFQANPDFERVARRAATPLEELRAIPVPPVAERERQDLEWIREELFRRRLFFGVALLFTFAPFMSIFRNGHLIWSALLENPWQVTFLCWSIAPLCWLRSFARLTRRASAILSSIYFALLPLGVTFHLFLPGWQADLSGRIGVALVIWLGALFIWANYLRLSRRERGPVGR
ncbi:MAG TPA: hypothetical protein VGR47_06485 [Terracidiphilus sp.]|nr:hypothetical protein [Terracidiphilus sp.]